MYRELLNIFPHSFTSLIRESAANIFVNKALVSRRNAGIFSAHYS